MAPPDSPAPVTASSKSLGSRVSTLAMLASPRALWKFLRDPKAPKASKLFFLFAMIYVISPVDAVPELFVPVFGFLDDIGFAAIALSWLASTAAKYNNAASAT